VVRTAYRTDAACRLPPAVRASGTFVQSLHHVSGHFDVRFTCAVTVLTRQSCAGDFHFFFFLVCPCLSANEPGIREDPQPAASIGFVTCSAAEKTTEQRVQNGRDWHANDFKHGSSYWLLAADLDTIQQRYVFISVSTQKSKDILDAVLPTC
jgi:hypothetical protein